MTNQAAPDWIGLSADSGTLRGWSISGGTVKASTQIELDDTSEPDATVSSLLNALEALPTTAIIACGAWFEPALRAVPCTPLPDKLIPVHMAGRTLHILPGLRQSTPSDVTQSAPAAIAGFQALNPGWDGVICLPGDTTLWVQISAGEVVSFQTYLSGTLAELITGHPLYQTALTGSDWDKATFDRTVEDALSRPEKLAARLFAIHADHLLEETAPALGKARLKGLLIGAEMAAARPYWLGMNIALIGAQSAVAPYVRALQTQGAPATLADADRMLIAGLTAAYRLLQEPTKAQ
ncbi:2-dehydro-3-deoxygalactonokinase DgoK [Sulfitobacter noctilucae]|uniref:2-dehydro-3-deoxygalactonokinase n=1 Tax=Sulfitobacter noctilucae TaxID=1342302 RepID=UPI00046A9139|nr:2-dehydro-3-deoxygalactonokinase [Sulfitobacter noctilucae]KIN60690.1 2-dehydro-3-deoxygalactonokinase DgoK [Sulfitobacter noctilucae]